jgi:hypothetical protein
MALAPVALYSSETLFYCLWYLFLLDVEWISRSPLKVSRHFGGTCHLHFRAKSKSCEKPVWKKDRAWICSETSVGFFKGCKQRYVPENLTLHNHRCWNPKFFIRFSAEKLKASVLLLSCSQVPLFSFGVSKSIKLCNYGLGSITHKNFPIASIHNKKKSWLV